MTKKQDQESATRAVVEHKPNTVAETVDFMVAGVFAEGRHRYVTADSVGEPIFLRREYANPHDKNAIAVYLKSGVQIGYMPKDYAKEVAPMIDAGARHDASIKKVLTEGRSPVPIVFAYLYSADTSPEIATSQKEVDEKFKGAKLQLLKYAAIVIALVLLLLAVK